MRRAVTEGVQVEVFTLADALPMAVNGTVLKAEAETETSREPVTCSLFLV